MSDVMNRSFTQREKILVLVLLVALLIGLYFLAVHYPIVERMGQIQQSSEDVENQIGAAEVKSAEYIAIKQELDAILSQPEEDITVMPAYNNIETLMRQLDVIFSGTSPDFSFGQARISDDIAARSITFSCTAKNYEEARRLLRDVTGTGYRCLLDSFTLTPADGDLYGGAVRVSGVVTFYEYVRQSEVTGN